MDGVRLEGAVQLTFSSISGLFMKRVALKVTGMIGKVFSVSTEVKHAGLVKRRPGQ